MKKIGIIGSSEFQLPLIKLAKEIGYETHVFSWGGNETASDFFYKISITEKDLILKKCKEIKVDGVCSIGSDLANITVNYIAHHMKLIGNSLNCTRITTNKYLMRKHLESKNVPIPKFNYINNSLVNIHQVIYPVIVKPADRSGSRGINLVNSHENLLPAIKSALGESFSKEVLIEQYITGREFSVESVSYLGKHYILQVTEKFTTGSPDFIEKGHTCPARITNRERELILDTVYKTLDAVDVEYGAAHTELKINEEGEIFIIEIGSRMGGDFIGSDLVFYSTGFDFTRAVLSIAMGEEFKILDFMNESTHSKASFVKFIFNKNDFDECSSYSYENSCNVIHFDYSDCKFILNRKVTSSADRFGHLLLVEDLKNQNETLKKLGF
ncbi:acetyl-CoA carboxylase biotin carboxylase subunit family protein [Aeromonas veronii]